MCTLEQYYFVFTSSHLHSPRFRRNLIKFTHSADLHMCFVVPTNTFLHFYICTQPAPCLCTICVNERKNKYFFFTFSFTLHSGHSSEHFNEFDSADYSWWSACTMAWLLHTEHMNILPWAPIPHQTIPRHTTLDQNLLTSPDYNLGCQGMVFFIACRLKSSLLLFPSC